jgi:hypothetical protein
MSVTGYPLPDTFYAKVGPPTEGGVEAWNIWWSIFLMEFPFIIVGAVTGVILVVKGKPHTWLLAISLTLLYRFTLPYFALINNFRYLIPVFDFFIITAIAGTLVVIKTFVQSLEIDTQVANFIVAIALAFFLWTLFPAYVLYTIPILVGYLVVTIFSISQFKIEKTADIRLIAGVMIFLLLICPSIPHYLYHADFFGNAVKNINEQQVRIGNWLRENTSEDAVLAIHDAGALRFFSERVVIDMARLISPDITHGNMTRNQEMIYLKEHNCTHFVFFDELFLPLYSGYLIGAYDVLFTVHLEDNVISGRDTMSVFLIRWEDSQFA